MQGEVSRKIVLHKDIISGKDQKKIGELLKYFWELKFEGQPVPEDEQFNPDWVRDVSVKITKKMGKEEDDVIEVEYRDRTVQRVDMGQMELFEESDEEGEGEKKLSQSEIAERRRKAVAETVDV